MQISLFYFHFMLLTLVKEAPPCSTKNFNNLLPVFRNDSVKNKSLKLKPLIRAVQTVSMIPFSSFSNQDDGGTILFGLDEKQHFAPVGVYDAQDLQKKLMEIGEAMTPIVRPVLSVFDENGKLFVTAEIPPVDLTDRPCYKTAKGRLKGSYLRVGDADKPMTEYEVYSYEAYRKKYRDDIRPCRRSNLSFAQPEDLDDYIARRKRNRPHFSAVPTDQLNELMNITKNGEVTLSAVLLFCPYPQSFFPSTGHYRLQGPWDRNGRCGNGWSAVYR